MDRHEWTGLDGLKRRAVKGGGIRQFNQLRRLWVLCTSSGEASAEILRLASRVKELEAEVEQELQGQVDISTAAGRMHDKARGLLERCEINLSSEVVESADHDQLLADLRRWLGKTEAP